MDTVPHTLPTLFDQLGLPSMEEAIDRFIEEHAPLEASLCLTEAEFWNDSQKSFLRDAIRDDSDWAEVVDQLDALLRI
ncbi:DUF2789 domain-containing protein [Porticoccaceae bacterium LTM1]|nr:DUF2789 domain-containing protein [Porticoccaceae bacterium LTM1]